MIELLIISALLLAELALKSKKRVLAFLVFVFLDRLFPSLYAPSIHKKALVVKRGKR